MKANQKFLNDRAEVGVGTLIVFIAMVLVAAVAAAVLINTTGSLQQRAQSTGKEATQEVSSNLKVLNVYGQRANDTSPPSGDINEINITATLSAGALPMDLTKLIIRFSDGSSAATFAYNDDYNADWIRGDGTNDVMQPGDLVQLHFETPSDLATRTTVQVSLIPETGSPVSADFKTPATYGDDTTITLR
jgi:flagellin FlaB